MLRDKATVNAGGRRQFKLSGNNVVHNWSGADESGMFPPVFTEAGASKHYESNCPTTLRKGFRKRKDSSETPRKEHWVG